MRRAAWLSARSAASCAMPRRAIYPPKADKREPPKRGKSPRRNPYAPHHTQGI